MESTDLLEHPVSQSAPVGLTASVLLKLLVPMQTKIAVTKRRSQCRN